MPILKNLQYPIAHIPRIICYSFNIIKSGFANKSNCINCFRKPLPFSLLRLYVWINNNSLRSVYIYWTRFISTHWTWSGHFANCSITTVQWRQSENVIPVNNKGSTKTCSLTNAHFITLSDSIDVVGTRTLGKWSGCVSVVFKWHLMDSKLIKSLCVTHHNTGNLLESESRPQAPAGLQPVKHSYVKR